MLLLLLLAVVVVAAVVVVDIVIVVDLPTEIVAPRVVVVVLSIRLVFNRRSSIQQRLHTRFNIEKNTKIAKIIGNCYFCNQTQHAGIVFDWRALLNLGMTQLCASLDSYS
jgi:hypothetical protein